MSDDLEEFQMTDDHRLVYRLRQSGWDRGRPVMVNEIAVQIDARHLPEASQAEIARVIRDALNREIAGCVNVSESPYNGLLREWQYRARTMGRDVAIHPATLARVLADLDKTGKSEAGDCIQSLVFEIQIMKNRNQLLE